MMNQKPFILKFRTRDNYYIYDVHTNRILLVNRAMYDIVDICRTKTKDEVFAELERIHPLPDLEFAYGRINELIARHDLFAPNILKTRVPLVSEDEVVKLLSQGIMQLCLEVTEACNMRCKYCAYSGGYPYNRRHGSRYMDFGTAKAAIDYFLPRASSEEGVAIGFYGGEPLLNFKLIRECVEYICFAQIEVRQTRPEIN